MRLINKDALIEWFKMCHFTKASIESIELFKEEDAVHVVRCKECKYCHKEENALDTWICFNNPLLSISTDDGGAIIHFHDNGCLHGERKGGRRMATIKELNNAIRIMKEYCHNQINGNCDACLLNKVCVKIECGGIPCVWDEIEEEDGGEADEHN